MKPITIIGGGLAGLTLGILLRRENISVTVLEAGTYPRHRVCGEFLSGRGRSILKALGIEERLPAKTEATTCSFHVRDRRPLRFDLVAPALCVSRFDLDQTLALEFQRLGGELRTGVRAEFRNTNAGVVRATGRRRAIDSGARLFGLKAHARRPAMSRDLEMHFDANRYVGICRLPSDEINVCGLFNFSRATRGVHEGWKNMLESVDSAALNGAQWDDASFCAVAGLTLDRDAPVDGFSIGDSAAMIPPLTGNGMSLAVESAEKASPFLRAYAAGATDWDGCLVENLRAWKESFSGRLRWAAFVQKLVFCSAGQQVLLLGTTLFPTLPNLFFSKTR